MSIATQISDLLIELVPSPVSLHEPTFGGREQELVADCVTSGWVSSVGKYVDQFEKNLTQYCGVEKAVAVSNGTSALHMCLLLAGVKPGDEVLVPALTFVATANAVAHCHAIPHFLEVSEETLNLDPVRIRAYLKEIVIMTESGPVNKHTGRKISALMTMHTFGHPGPLDELMALAQEFSVPFIEDAAEALGSKYKSKHVGNFGLLSCLSFNGNKIITTGGGGAILTNSSELGARAKYITTTAKEPHAWEFVHTEVGYNYRLPNINAALGCAQMEKLPEFLIQKRKLAHSYQEKLAGFSSFRVFEEPEYAESNYWLNCLILNDANMAVRDEILKKTNEAKVMTRPFWRPLHKLKPFLESPRMSLPVTDMLSERTICLPSTPSLELK